MVPKSQHHQSLVGLGFFSTPELESWIQELGCASSATLIVHENILPPDASQDERFDPTCYIVRKMVYYKNLFERHGYRVFKDFGSFKYSSNTDSAFTWAICCPKCKLCNEEGVEKKDVQPKKL